MKNEKGFTLVELLSVVTILVVLALIITPIIDKNIRNSKEKMYRIQIENIRMACENYFVDNINERPTVDGNYKHIKVSKLINEDYIGVEIINPKTGKAFTEDLYVQLKNNNGTYVYTVCPIEDNCESYVGN